MVSIIVRYPQGRSRGGGGSKGCNYLGPEIHEFWMFLLYTKKLLDQLHI